MYTLLIERDAEKGFKRIPKNISNKLITKIKSLKDNPKPGGCRKITGSENDYRVRVGDYRVIYEINENNKQVIILAVGHRKDIYKNI